MKQFWTYRFEISIALMGILLLGNFFFTTLISQAAYICLLIMFLLSILLWKLSAINEHMKNKINQGGIL